MAVALSPPHLQKGAIADSNDLFQPNSIAAYETLWRGIVTHRIKAAISGTIVLILSGCSQSELDRCIASQMNAWEQDRIAYENAMESRVDLHEPDSRHMIGNVEVSGDVLNSLGAPRSPGTREEAMARANLECGEVYARSD